MLKVKVKLVDFKKVKLSVVFKNENIAWQCRSAIFIIDVDTF